MNVCVVGNGPSCMKNVNGDFINSCDVVIRMGHCVIEGWEKYIGSKVDIYCTCNRKWPFFIDANINHDQKDFDFVSNILSICKTMWVCEPEFIYKRYYDNYLNKINTENVDIRFMTCAEFSGLSDESYMGNRLIIDKKKHEELLMEISIMKKNSTPQDVLFNLYEKLFNNFHKKPSTGYIAIYMAKKLFKRSNLFITGFDGNGGRYSNESYTPLYQHQLDVEQDSIQSKIKSGELTLI